MLFQIQNQAYRLWDGGERIGLSRLGEARHHRRWLGRCAHGGRAHFFPRVHGDPFQRLQERPAGSQIPKTPTRVSVVVFLRQRFVYVVQGSEGHQGTEVAVNI